MRGYLLLVAVGLTLAGCFPIDGIVCTANFVYGMNVTVTAADGTPITGATLTLVENDYQETMQALGDMSPGVYIGAGERGGTYTLSIEADGFETATIDGIFVDDVALGVALQGG